MDVPTFCSRDIFSYSKRFCRNLNFIFIRTLLRHHLLYPCLTRQRYNDIRLKQNLITLNKFGSEFEFRLYLTYLQDQTSDGRALNVVVQLAPQQILRTVNISTPIT